MKKLIGTVLAVSMIAGTTGNVAMAKIDANDSVFGYQIIDFEKYDLGSKPITKANDTSADGSFTGSSTNYSPQGDGDYEIVGDASNKYIKVTTYRDPENGMGAFATFKGINKDATLSNDMDYFVKSFKLKNGDNDNNVTTYLNINGSFRVDENSISDSSNRRQYLNQYDWNDISIVADKANGKGYVVVNGQITDVVATDDCFRSVESFYGNPFTTIYSAIKSGQTVYYVDDYEMYGVKSATNEVDCTITQDENNEKVLYAKFNHAVNFGSSNISVTNGGTVSDVVYENGVYKITLASVPKSGCKVTISGAVDVFGTTSSAKEFTINSNITNDVKYGYQKVDFEDKTVGDSLIPTGKTDSTDGIFSVQNNDKEDYTIVNENGGKALKIHTEVDFAGGYISAFNNNPEINDPDIAYFVINYDFRNGGGQGDNPFAAMAFLRMSIREDEGANISNYGQGWTCTSDIKSYKFPVANAWNHYSLVYERATGKLFVAVNGVITGMEFEQKNYSASDFYRLQWWSPYSRTNREETAYLDNVEMYGLKSDEMLLTCNITTPEIGSSKAFVEFNHPVNFSKDNIIGVDVKSIEYVDGKYEIDLENLVSGVEATIMVTEVTDIYGLSSSIEYKSFTPQFEVNDVKYGYQLVDFEDKTVGERYIPVGKTDSADRIFSVENNDKEDYTIINENGGKALKIHTDTDYRGGYISAFNNNPEINDPDIDYYVINYDFRNGGGQGDNPFAAMAFLRKSIREDDGTQILNYGQGWTCTSDIKSYKFPVANAWNHYSLVYERATGKLFVAVNGVITGMEFEQQNYNASDFYRLQWWSPYSRADREETAYLDNVEMYGLKKNEIGVTCEISAPSIGSNKVIVEFNHPVSFSASDLSGIDVGSIVLVNGKYEIELANVGANEEYTVTVGPVKDIYGCTSISKSLTFRTGLVENAKTYLSTDARFTGSDDFEGYDGVGVITSAINPTVTLKKNGYDIKDIYPTSTGNAGGIEYSLVDLDGNKAFKIGVPGTVTTSEFTTIFQVKPDINWTNDVNGKIFVYKIDVKSGGNGETPFYTMPLGLGSNLAEFYFSQNHVAFGGVKATIKSSEWNTVEYIVDCTGDDYYVTLVINGKTINTVKANKQDIKNSAPRWAAAYPLNGASNSSLYFDNLEIYTTTGVQENLDASISKEEIFEGEAVVVKFTSPLVELAMSNIESSIPVRAINALSNNRYAISFEGKSPIGENVITVKNVKDVYGNTLENKVLSYNVVAGGNIEGITDVLSSSTSQTVEITNTGDVVTGARVYVVGYDKNGAVIEVKAVDTTINPGINKCKISWNRTCDELRIFVWNAQNLTPLCEQYKK